MKALLALALAGALCVPAAAAPRSITLSLPTMDCAVCPITVKKALMKVDGVGRAEVSLDKRQAVVTFDDARTSVPALTRATQDAGYPSTVVGGPK
jgi:mercuric ion binding protein